MNFIEIAMLVFVGVLAVAAVLLIYIANKEK
jgi:ABC-type multidrug transport system permease subunit